MSEGRQAQFLRSSDRTVAQAPLSVTHARSYSNVSRKSHYSKRNKKNLNVRFITYNNILHDLQWNVPFQSNFQYYENKLELSDLVSIEINKLNAEGFVQITAQTRLFRI